MEVLDLRTLKIVEVEKVFTHKMQLDANELLNAPMSVASEKIKDAFKIGFKNKNLLVSITLKNLIGETAESKQADFEFLCEMLVSAALDRNRTTEERTAEEKGKIMNTLPYNHGWTLPKFVSERINCAYMTLRKCGDYEFANKAITIQIETAEGDFIYRFINPKESEA